MYNQKQKTNETSKQDRHIFRALTITLTISKIM